MVPRPAPGERVTGAVAASVALHVAILAMLFGLRPTPSAVAVPVYRVDLVAAPSGSRRVGTVAPDAPDAVARPAPPPSAPVVAPPAATLPAVRPPAVRPAPSGAVAQRPAARPIPSPPVPASTGVGLPPQPVRGVAPAAAGGPNGGAGADVATIRTEGAEFPFPAYLANIVRQVALRFEQARCAVCRADLRFLIHRDGTVSEIRVVRGSGNFGFDLDAQGAVEAAGRAHSFGPLPSGFTDDVLTVVFSFDPRTVR